VFATLRPEQIDLARSNRRGVADFKHFLEYAIGGQSALAKANSPTGWDTESPFEDAVMEALKNRGWEVHPQVGVSGFRVDLGIVHPDFPGRYLAGVECDGATYHSYATARDRDRLRETILRRLGWRLRRVWSTEWWQGAEAAAGRLHHQLTSDLAQDRVDQPPQKACTSAASEPILRSLPPRIVKGDVALRRDDSTVTQSDAASDFSVAPASLRSPAYAGPTTNGSRPKFGPVYEIADLSRFGSLVDAHGFYEIGYQPVLRQMVEFVVEKEGPIFSDLVITRIARAHGFARSGGRIRETVSAAIDSDFARSHQGQQALLWPKKMEPANSIDFRPASLEIRALNDIPDVELIGLAKAISRDCQDREATLLEMASTIGIGRITDGIRLRLNNAIDRCHALNAD
jgi:very-short-patch-repair endonuclease